MNSTKPVLRGRLHQFAFFASLAACASLISNGTSGKALFSSLVYSVGLLSLFGISAIYHIPHWEPRKRAFLKRLDHSAIFIFIAGTMTPVALLALPEAEGRSLLMAIWTIAVLGTLQSIFWIKAPKWVTAIFYIFAGWQVLPYMPSLKESLSENEIIFIVVGGIVYTTGAILYAIKRPALWAKTFGYHELFHLMTVVAAAFHFVVIYSLVD